MKKVIGILVLILCMCIITACTMDEQVVDTEKTRNSQVVGIESIEDYQVYVKDIDKGDINTLDDAFEKARVLLSDDMSKNDEIFMIFFDLANDICDGRYIDDKSKIETNFVDYSSNEGDLYLTINYEVVFNSFRGMISDSYTAYGDILVKQQTQLRGSYLINDAAVMIGWNDLANWIGEWEKYISTYNDNDILSKRANEELSILIKIFLLSDLDNTMLYERDTLLLKDWAKQGLQYYISSYKDSKNYQLVKGYYDMLESRAFVLDRDVLSYLEKSDIHSTIYSEWVPVDEVLGDNELSKLYSALLLKEGITDNIVYINRANFNDDNKNEVVIATGKKVEKDIFDINEVIIVEERIDKLKVLAKKDTSSDGYATCNVDIVKLINIPGDLLYLKKTNDIDMWGFSVLGLSDKGLYNVLYSTSPTGAGLDNLTDGDDDGIYDGYTQKRWSYDVFNYEVESVFKYSEGDFIQIKNNIALGEYPKDIKGVITEYLSLQYLRMGKSIDVDKRIEMLNYDTLNLDVDSGVAQWRNILEQLINDNGTVLYVTKGDTSDKATARLVDKSESDDYKIDISFNMILQEGLWHIASIDLNEALDAIDESDMPNGVLGVLVKNPDKEVSKGIIQVRESIIDNNTGEYVLIVPKYNKTLVEIRELNPMGDTFAQHVVVSESMENGGGVLVKIAIPSGMPTHKIVLKSNGITSEMFINSNGIKEVNNKSYILIK